MNIEIVSTFCVVVVHLKVSIISNHPSDRELFVKRVDRVGEGQMKDLQDWEKYFQ